MNSSAAISRLLRPLAARPAVPEESGRLDRSRCGLAERGQLRPHPRLPAVRPDPVQRLVGQQKPAPGRPSGGGCAAATRRRRAGCGPRRRLRSQPCAGPPRRAAPAGVLGEQRLAPQHRPVGGEPLGVRRLPVARRTDQRCRKTTPSGVTWASRHARPARSRPHRARGARRRTRRSAVRTVVTSHATPETGSGRSSPRPSGG